MKKVNSTEISAARPTSGRLFEEYLHSLSFMCDTTNDYKHLGYGKFCGHVAFKSKDYCLTDLRVKSWSFTVPDTKFGIMAVAKALGHGMADLSPILEDEEAQSKLENNYGIKLKKARRRSSSTLHEQTTICVRPVLTISPDTAGYRCVWGGLLDTCCENARIDGPDDSWSVDFYELHTGIKDGGCLVQSSTSAATIVAKKSGNAWTVTLTMPMLDHGNVVGRSYESAFRGAQQWYCSSIEQQRIA